MSRRVLVHLTSLSFAYPVVPAGDRARLLEPQIPADGIGIFVLATCLRVELAWKGRPDSADTVLEELYGQRPLPEARVRTEFDAFHHLARVAAGLESAQVGEAEVLSQYRQALEPLAERSDDQLAGAMETALGVARAARRSLSDTQEGSLAVAAASLIGDLDDVVVIGGGAMGRAVVRQLPPSRVAVYSRRSQPVADIPSRPWEDLPQALASCRAVISTVPGPLPVLSDLQRRDGDPLVLVDLGMPPAVERPYPSDVIYHGVDEVASSLPSTAEPEAEQIVASEAEEAWRRLSISKDAKSIISSVFDLVDRTVDDEVRRFAHRLSATQEPEPVLRQLAHNVARRIVHPSVSLLGSTPLTPEDLEVMAKAFGIDRE